MMDSIKFNIMFHVMLVILKLFVVHIWAFRHASKIHIL